MRGDSLVRPCLPSSLSKEVVAFLNEAGELGDAMGVSVYVVGGA